MELAQQADAEQDEAQEWQLEAEANLTESPLSAEEYGHWMANCSIPTMI